MAIMTHEPEPLELAVYYWIRAHPDCSWHMIQDGFMPESFEEIDTILASLISQSYIAISAEQPLTYHVVAGKEI